MSGVLRHLLVQAAMALIWASAASAGSIAVQTETVPGLSPGTSLRLNRIRITGALEAGDSLKIRDLLLRLKKEGDSGAGTPLATAELSGPGGDVLEGVRIGYLFREFNVATVVRTGAQCLSACAFAFLGGTAGHLPLGVEVSRSVEPGACVGFRNISHEALSHGGKGSDAASVMTYVDDIGVPSKFIHGIMQDPSDGLHTVDTIHDYLALEICATEPVMPAASMAQQAVNVCNNATGWASQADASRATPLSADEVRLLLLRHVHGNIGSLGVAERFAAQLRGVIESNNRRLVASTYDGLQAAGLPLPRLKGQAYLVQGYTAGIYQLACVVALSSNEPSQFDLVVLGPKGLAAASQPPPASCPWLYRHDRRDLLYPPRG